MLLISDSPHSFFEKKTSKVLCFCMGCGVGGCICACALCGERVEEEGEGTYVEDDEEVGHKTHGLHHGCLSCGAWEPV